MTDPEPASSPCQAPPGYWDADDETPTDDRDAETPSHVTGDE
jgi:hypothetical protein